MRTEPILSALDAWMGFCLCYQHRIQSNGLHGHLSVDGNRTAGFCGFLLD